MSGVSGECTWADNEKELDILGKPQGELWKGEVVSCTTVIRVNKITWNIFFGTGNSTAYIHVGKFFPYTKKKVA